MTTLKQRYYDQLLPVSAYNGNIPYKSYVIANGIVINTSHAQYPYTLYVITDDETKIINKIATGSRQINMSFETSDKNISKLNDVKNSRFSTLTVKVCILGYTGSGKSCIVTRFANNTFNSQSLPTLGFSRSIVTMIDSALKKKIKLDLFDMSGQEKLRSWVDEWRQGSAAALCVYDITDIYSFHIATQWINQFYHYKNGFVSCLVGNKNDLSERKVSFKEGKEVAENKNCLFFETSAKDSINIQEIFEALVKEVFKKASHDWSKGQIVKQGTMCKTGARNKTYRTRYFILYDDKQLYYFKNENHTKQKGIINLNKIIDIQKKNEQNKFLLYINTGDRVWNLKVNNSAERDAWYSAIHSVHGIKYNTDISQTISQQQFQETKVMDDHDPFVNLNHDQTTSHSITDCEPLKRLAVMLKYYQDIHSDNHVAEKWYEYISDEKYFNGLLNDYHHILSSHLNAQNQLINTNNYIYIDKLMQTYIKCNVSNCKCIARNNRNINIVSTVVDIADTIHTYFVHGFDIGLRTKITVSDVQEQGDDDKKHNVDAMLYHDQQLSRLKRHLSQKRERFCALSKDRVTSSKFMTKVLVHEYEEEKNNNSTDNSSHDEYSFGNRFYYWKHYKHLKEVDPYNPGYEYRDWYIVKKYDTLKEEMLLCMKENEIDISSFNEAVAKAIFLFSHSKTIKKMKSRDENPKYGGSVINYGMPTSTPINVSNILCIIFYCDFSKLSCEFSATFRKKFPNETDESLKRRNSKFWNLSKLLIETVHLYGNALNYMENEMTDDYSNKSKIYDIQIPVLYHGISFLYFNSFLCRFCSPTSMTTQLEVATMFSGNSGIICEIEQYGYKSTGHHPYYFNCSFISRFALENEMLFIGGTGWNLLANDNIYDGGLLQFRSLRNIEKEENYIWCIRALLILNIVINGKQLNWMQKKEFVKPIKWYCDIIYHLLSQIKITDEKNINKIFPVYIEKCTKKFIKSKKILTIDMYFLHNDYSSFIKLFPFSLEKGCTNLLLFDHVATVFDECEQIILNMNGSDLFQTISLKLIRNLIDILLRISNDKRVKLRLIKLVRFKFATNLNLKIILKLFENSNCKWSVNEQIFNKKYNALNISYE
eukprot:44_1